MNFSVLITVTPIPAASIRPLKYRVFPVDSTPVRTVSPAACHAAAWLKNRSRRGVQGVCAVVCKVFHPYW
jgi:hypothetical protein